MQPYSLTYQDALNRISCPHNTQRVLLTLWRMLGDDLLFTKMADVLKDTELKEELEFHNKALEVLRGNY